MELVTGRPNVELRRDRDGERVVVLSFPYDRALVDLVRTIPHRRFDWETREWSAPAEDWAALKVVEALERYPELSVAPDVGEWLADVGRRWIGAVTTTRYDGRGWWVLRTLAGSVPAELRDAAIERADGALLVPISQAAARVLARAALDARRRGRRALPAGRRARWRSARVPADLVSQRRRRAAAPGGPVGSGRGQWRSESSRAPTAPVRCRWTRGWPSR